MKRAVFLDRDGVLNKTIFRDGKPRAPYTLEDFALLEDVAEGIQLLRDNNFTLIVVTNQPDVARGWVSREAVDAVNNKLRELIEVDDIKICFHDSMENCLCRKPKPGMLIDAAREMEIDLKNSFMIGDRHSDVEAGIDAGCRTFLVGQGDHSSTVTPDYQVESLLEAARIIIKL